MFVSQQNAIRFFELSQADVISAFLRCDREALEKAFQKAFEIHCAMIRRALDETPAVTFGVDEEEGRVLLATFRRRTPENLDQRAKKEMLFQDIEDIHELLDMMEPLGENVCLFRKPAEKAENGMTDCAELAAAWAEKAEEENHCRIHLPKGTPVLKTEKGYILPPMRCREENGELYFSALLPVDPIITKALMAYGL